MALMAATDGYETTYEGWREVPVWFVLTLEDRAMPVQAQRMLSKRAKKEGADVTVREIDSGHFAMLSKPDELVDFLLQAFKAFAERGWVGSGNGVGEWNFLNGDIENRVYIKRVSYDP
jgi:pimeloyl-ACP methyl ester carboxylesterase